MPNIYPGNISQVLTIGIPGPPGPPGSGGGEALFPAPELVIGQTGDSLHEVVNATSTATTLYGAAITLSPGFAIRLNLTPEALETPGARLDLLRFRAKHTKKRLVPNTEDEYYKKFYPKGFVHPEHDSVITTRYEGYESTNLITEWLLDGLAPEGLIPVLATSVAPFFSLVEGVPDQAVTIASTNACYYRARSYSKVSRSDILQQSPSGPYYARGAYTKGFFRFRYSWLDGEARKYSAMSETVALQPTFCNREVGGDSWLLVPSLV